MKYVLDANVALRWVIPGLHTAKALQLRDDYLNNIHELLAPDIYLAEVASALTKAERQKLIAVGQATPLYAQIAVSTPVFHPYLPLTARALEISSQTRSGFYDCLYVALAEGEGCEMVTADDKLLKNLQGQFKFIIHLTAVP
jgi:predicted nucleic acid-binding protein